ncbi:tape measure protein [Shinella zoogloeoides]|uniref:tape measure protein n=1 Tax=Shinella zoogloeoides TaxID=352475 RepID=UPI001F5A7AFA|nr:tape measure protein [Shinella zoogloeoides]
MANKDMARVVLQMEAEVTKLRKDFDKAEGIVKNSTNRMASASNRAAKQMETNMSRAAGKVGAAAGGMASRLAGAFAAAASIGAAVQLVDAAKKIENALKVTGLEGEALTAVYDSLFAAAQKNAAPIESLTTLYSKLALVQNELGVSGEELIGFTDKIALALRVGGTDAVAASGALLQLSQALGGGVVRAEEFNSVLEGAPTIAQAAAAGLREAGGSVAKLRTLVVDGKVSSEAFFRAFEAGAVTLEQKVAGSGLTVSQQFVQLQNVLVDTAGKIDKATDASGRLGKGIESLADVVRGFGQIIAETADSDLGKLLGWFDNAIDKADQFRKVMGGIPGIVSKLSQVNQEILTGKPIGSTLNEQNIQNRIDAAFEGTGVTPKSGRLPATPKVETVSIDDYKVSGAKTGGRSGGRASASKDDLDRELKQIRERTDALTASYAAQAALNPLVNDYGFALEKARAKQELLAAAQRDGKEITTALEQDIDAAAEAYARAGAAVEQLSEKQGQAREAAEFFGQTLFDSVSDFIPKIETGNTALDKFVNTLADAAAQALLLGKGPLAGLFGGGGGLFGSGGGGALLGATFSLNIGGAR